MNLIKRLMHAEELNVEFIYMKNGVADCDIDVEKPAIVKVVEIKEINKNDVDVEIVKDDDGYESEVMVKVEYVCMNVDFAFLKEWLSKPKYEDKFDQGISERVSEE